MKSNYYEPYYSPDEKKEWVNKACKYLQEHREEVETEDNGISGWISNEFIENFKKAMEK